MAHMERQLYVVATVLNAADLASSYMGFTLRGLTELNAWASIIHNPYLACLVAVLLYQAVITVLLLAAGLVRRGYVLLAPMIAIKVYAVANNIAWLL